MVVERTLLASPVIRAALRFPRNRIRQNAPIRCLTSSQATPSPPPGPKASGPGKLAEIIKGSIKATGPIPVSRYMQLCLGHPIDGYYTRQRETGDVFGKKGDFITSPEISQMFGELIAIWLITQWVAQGRAKKVRLIELGPGRGTLMDDILRTFLSIPTFPISNLIAVELVELSLPMREQQKQLLGKRIKTFGGHADNVELKWWDRIADVPAAKDTFTCVIAHEFFDALPINVFQNTPEGFREVYVNLGSELTAPPPSPSPSTSPAPETTTSPLPSSTTPNPPLSSSELTLALSRIPTTLSHILPSTSPRFATTPAGERIEISTESWEMMRVIGELVSGRRGALKVLEKEREGEEAPIDLAEGEGRGVGGAGLVIDYGEDGVSSNSFRAFRNHEIVNVFDDPGSADLTANVDFAYLKESLTGVATPHGPLTQRAFLTSLGLAPRLNKLLQSAPSKERKNDIAVAARRLVEEDGMGGQYKFLGVTPEGVGEVYPFVETPKE